MGGRSSCLPTRSSATSRCTRTAPVRTDGKRSTTRRRASSFTPRRTSTWKWWSCWISRTACPRRGLRTAGTASRPCWARSTPRSQYCRPRTASELWSSTTGTSGQESYPGSRRTGEPCGRASSASRRAVSTLDRRAYGTASSLPPTSSPRAAKIRAPCAPWCSCPTGETRAARTCVKELRSTPNSGACSCTLWASEKYSKRRSCARLPNRLAARTTPHATSPCCKNNSSCWSATCAGSISSRISPCVGRASTERGWW